MADPAMVFFQAKSKYRWCSHRLGNVLPYLMILLCTVVVVDCEDQNKGDVHGVQCGSAICEHGSCRNETCECDQGWVGGNCDACGGRIRLTGPSGYITEGRGNYTLNMKCSWLLEGPPNATIRLRLDHFATECSWDHLYVYDGASVFSPTIAVFSGLVIQQKPANWSVPEVTAHSGSVYLHFYSDAAYNMSGFNISYTMRECPQNCSGHGVCQSDQVCLCDENYIGEACETALCPNDCLPHGSCEKSYRGKKRCECQGYRGADCSIPDHLGVWQYMVPQMLDRMPGGRASHKAVVQGDDLWVVSGDNFGVKPFDEVVKYNFLSGKWDVIEPKSGDNPGQRYGHSLVQHQDKLYMYGGLRKVILDELWRFDTRTNWWSRIEVRPEDRDEMIAVVGHTAHIIGGIMYVIFGHSPVYGYMNTVQEYNLSANSWQVPKTSGAIVKGGYGHSSVYDEHKGLVYIHAGYHSRSVSHYYLSDSLYSFNPKTRHWTIKRSSGQYKYLHSAVILSDLMLVFGGNTHNDTSMSHGAKCYSADFLAYDMDCDRWYDLGQPKLDREIARFGASAVVYRSAMYVFGGFNGLMLNDLFKFLPGECKGYVTEETCLKAHQGVKCVWTGANQCTTWQEAERLKSQKFISSYTRGTCPLHGDDIHSKCSSFSTCPSCVETSYSCQWCNDRCTGSHCDDPSGKVDLARCKEKFPKFTSECTQLHNCHACNQSINCKWITKDKKCNFQKPVEAEKEDENDDRDRQTCAPSCHVHTTCENCTSASCMWCTNQLRCVESNSYVASFPYGQCMEWTTQPAKCPGTYCSELRTCMDCQANPLCGWCDDVSNTGSGVCMAGGSHGPVDFNGTVATTSTRKCPAERWYFVGCPLCQCNGHSTCYDETNECEECRNLTTGPHCEFCKEGFYGNPINGGNCTPCDCNSQADFCNRKTGVCHCRTRGVMGDHCEQCDEAHKYFGNPKGGGTCHYDLTTDYQFTFNLSKEDDKYYTQINFMNTPNTPDRDVDFSINCSGKALMNITYKTKNLQAEQIYVSGFECRFFKAKFTHKEYPYGKDQNTTFYVSLYDFKTPFWLQISFSQFPQIDLVHFFVTFFSCFLSLLFMAAVSWKVRQRYHLYRRRQRMFVEMEQMASRPFATCAIDITDPNDAVSTKKEPPDLRGSRRKKLHSNKLNKPSPVALEPLFGHKAAALALLVRLPTGDEEHTPPEQSGLAIASSLVTLGNPRKTSVEHSKGEKNKARKMVASSPDNCI